MTNYQAKPNKNSKILFSVICLSIIALGVIVYFASVPNTDSVTEQTTLEQTTDVQKEVSGVEKETTKATKKETTTKAPTTMEAGDTNTPYLSFYKYPLNDAVLKGYTEELVYDETMEDYRAHTAIDFSGKEGDEVVAANDGLVLSVKTDALYGTVVKIDHGAKLVAVYAGMKTVNVSEGDMVTIGQALGTLGTIPCESSMEAHLHFEMILEDEYVNPLKVMSKETDEEETTQSKKSSTKETTKAE